MQISLHRVTKYAKCAIYQFGTISNFLNPQTSLLYLEENAVSPTTVAGREAKAELISYDPRPLRGLAVLGIEQITHSL